jgi:hypothetical protein
MTFSVTLNVFNLDHWGPFADWGAILLPGGRGSLGPPLYSAMHNKGQESCAMHKSPTALNQ